MLNFKSYIEKKLYIILLNCKFVHLFVYISFVKEIMNITDNIEYLWLFITPVLQKWTAKGFFTQQKVFCMV